MLSPKSVVKNLPTQDLHIVQYIRSPRNTLINNQKPCELCYTLSKLVGPATGVVCTITPAALHNFM
jgi:hypothetical protein